MKTIFVTPQNIDEAIALINTAMEGKTYWSDVAGIGRVGSAEEYIANPDFLGRGTLYRIFTAKASKGKIHAERGADSIKIAYKHEGLHADTPWTTYDILHNLEVIIEGSDVLIFEKDNTYLSKESGGTCIYLEKTTERVKLWEKRHRLVSGLLKPKLNIV